MKIIFPELKTNLVAKQAIKSFPNVEFIPADSPAEAAKILKDQQADSIVTGLDYQSREVLLAFKRYIPLKSQFFSSCFIAKKDKQVLAIGDGGVNKNPTKEQLYSIVKDTATTFQAFTGKTPKIAMLSYSTFGSGGKNPDLEKIYYVVNKIRDNYLDWIIDGEMQLDAAVNQKVALKKAFYSPLRGQANILITPDLNSGNILYKALEQFAGFTIAGPIVQGFTSPLADLSRGSTVEDVILTLEIIIKQLERS